MEAPFKPSTNSQRPKEGRDAVAFDVCIDGQRMNLATPHGFSNALWAVSTLRPGGGHLTAPVCSTFVLVPLYSNQSA